MDPARPPRLKVVYILGSSRSGSTILDATLGTAASTLSTGELGHIFWAFDPSEAPSVRVCSCGLPATECPVWSKVWSELGTRYDLKALEGETRRFEEPVLSSFARLPGRLFRTRAFSRHLDFLADSFRTVARLGGVQAVIDSSKLPGRGWLCSLLPREEFDVRFIHMVRDGRSVVSSMLTHYHPHQRESVPSPWPRWAGTAFSTAHWVYMNMFSSLLGALNRDRYLRVRYEEFVSRPSETLLSIESFLGMDLGEARRRVEAGEPLSPGHLLCGNRAKQAPLLKARPPEAVVDQLSLGSSFVFLSLGGWLQWIYLHPSPRHGGIKPGF
jgi:hypothetical protein